MNSTLIALFASAVIFSAGPAVAQRAIGFSTVAEALDTLKRQPGMSSTTGGDGFLTLSTADGKTTWSFAAKNDPAYPAVVRRDLVDRDGGIYMDMSVLCEASGAACRMLVQRFQAANAEIRRKIEAPQR